MLDNLMCSINIVLPLVLMMALGYLLRAVRLVGPDFARTGTRVAFTVAFPCSIFSSLAGFSLAEIFDGRLLLFMMAGITLSMLAPLAIVPRLVKDRPTAASMVQAMFRANFLIQGIPLLINTYGEGNIATGAFLLPFAILANNVLSTVIFVALIPGQRGNGKSPVLGALGKMALNPLIIGSVVGLLFSAFGWKLPAAISSTVTQVGRLGTPLAMICMGADFRLSGLRRDLKYTLPSVLVRLIVIPGLMTAAAVLLGFRGVALGSIYLFNATCTAAAGYVMSAAMGGNSDISAQCVGLSAVLSAFTMTAGLFVLLQFGLI